MTIGSIAKQLDVSSMTIYRRLKRAGIDVASLRDAETGELTSEGLATIGSLFARTESTTSTTTESTTRTQQAPQQAEMEAVVLRVKLEAAMDTVARLDAECEQLRGQVERLTAMLEAEQRQRQALLPAPGQRRGLFGWRRRREE